MNKRTPILILLIIVLIGTHLNAQQIEYSYFMTSYKSLKEYLLRHDDYFNGGNTKNAYFQGEYSNNYIKFYDNGLNNVAFDVNSSSEFLTLINEIKRKANFRYKYCTSYDEPVVYNYFTQNGNTIRYSKDKARISVEYHSELTSFLKENEGLLTAFVCLSKDAYAFHTNLKCVGLNNCESDIAKTTFNEARKYKYRICEICTDDSELNGDNLGSAKTDVYTITSKEVTNRSTETKNIEAIKVPQLVIEKAKEKFDIYLQSFLESQGEGAVFIERQLLTGDFTGDNVEDVVIEFQWGIPNIVVPQAVFYETKNNEPVFVTEYELDSYWFNIDEINNGLIYVTTQSYGEDDPRCCPSIEAKVIYKYRNNKLYRQ